MSDAKAQGDEPGGPRTVEVAAEEAGQRIDNFLLRYLKGVPRSHIYRLLRKGEVRVNSGRIRPTYRLRPGDRVRVPPVRTAAERPGEAVPSRVVRQLEAAVVYEDAALVVVDKPSGLAVHGGSGLAFGLIEALRAGRPDAGGLELVHRLDRGTSGCLVVAKSREALKALHEQLRQGQVTKTYLALVAGRWAEPETVSVALARTREGAAEQYTRVDRGGQAARTRFEPRAVYRDATLVEARLDTGRMHQIRVHAAYAGHPVAGDGRYGDHAFNRRVARWGLKRMFLHAHTVGLVSPASGERIEVRAPLPQALETVLANLETN